LATDQIVKEQVFPFFANKYYTLYSFFLSNIKRSRRAINVGSHPNLQ